MAGQQEDNIMDTRPTPLWSGRGERWCSISKPSKNHGTGIGGEGSGGIRSGFIPIVVREVRCSTGGGGCGGPFIVWRLWEATWFRLVGVRVLAMADA